MTWQLAAIADIHGNTWALDAVLEDIRRRGIERVVNLGDSVYGSLDPAGAAERLMAPQIVSISGNQDRIVFDQSAAIRRSRDHQFVASRMSAAQLDWLQAQPPTLVIGD